MLTRRIYRGRRAVDVRLVCRRGDRSHQTQEHEHELDQMSGRRPRLDNPGFGPSGNAAEEYQEPRKQEDHLPSRVGRVADVVADRSRHKNSVVPVC